MANVMLIKLTPITLHSDGCGHQNKNELSRFTIENKCTKKRTYTNERRNGKKKK